MVLLLLLLLFGLLICLVFLWVDCCFINPFIACDNYICGKQYHTKMDREMIKKMYLIEPNRWELCTNEKDVLCYSIYRKGRYYPEKIKIYIQLTFFDYRWLLKEKKKYLKKQRIAEEQKTNITSMKLLLETGQKDIEKYREKAQKEIEEALKIQEEIYENLNL